MDTSFNDSLRLCLLGRRLREDCMPEAHQGRPMFSFWGQDLGLEGVYRDRAYRIYLSYDENCRITGVDPVVEGDLISPCSGWFPEALDRFDYEAVRDWCLRRTEGV